MIVGWHLSTVLGACFWSFMAGLIVGFFVMAVMADAKIRQIRRKL